MNDGFILLHRKMLENAIFYKADYYQIWCYILLKVNHKDNEMIWNNEKKVVKKGSGIFSQKKISEELKIPIGTVHNALKYLKSESQIEIKSTSRYTEIQVVKWEEYQSIESIIENRVKSGRKLGETNKHDKHDKQLRELCAPFIPTYGKDMIEKFIHYWTETKNGKGSEKWQKQKTWETEKRLVTWKNNDLKFANKKPIQKANGLGGAVI
jgi:DNA-binding transcriptional regulator YhcF (GntR family)